jgi:hypothetical protein
VTGGRRGLGAVVAACLIATAPGAASADDHEMRVHSGPPPEAAQLDPQTAAVAGRLWKDLVRLCDRCERMTLSACRCHDSAADRKHILEQLRGRDLASPAGADAAYQAVLLDYVKRKGKEVLASERSSRALADWPAWVVSDGVLALACAAVAVIEHRRKRSPRARPRRR